MFRKINILNAGLSVFQTEDGTYTCFVGTFLTLSCVNVAVIMTIVDFQLFYSFFKSLVGKDVVVELKNDLR